MAAQQLFRRACRVTVGSLVLERLRVTFEVDKSLEPEPNTAEIRVTNLNGDHRKELQEAGGAVVQLEAGYAAPEVAPDVNAALAGIGLEPTESTLPKIFLGQMRQAYSYREGPDWVTVLSSGDSEQEQRSNRASLSFRPGVRLMQVFDALIKKTGLSAGNAFGELNGKLLFDQTAGPLAIAGNAMQELQKLSRSFGLQVSVQDGELQMLEQGKPLRAGAIVLGPGTGLIGSPEPASDGLIKFRALLQPDIFPGRAVELEAAHAQGRYRVEQATYLGDTHGGPWYVDCEGKSV